VFILTDQYCTLYGLQWEFMREQFVKSEEQLVIISSVISFPIYSKLSSVLGLDDAVQGRRGIQDGTQEIDYCRRSVSETTLS
jgi:hypothetical protein